MSRPGTFGDSASRAQSIAGDDLGEAVGARGSYRGAPAFGSGPSERGYNGQY